MQNTLSARLVEVEVGTSWVMQILPAPIPTLSPSTPASIRFLACEEKWK